MHDEINRLNNELSITKRELSKQNYLLQATQKKFSNSKITDDIEGVYTKNYLLSKFRETISISKRLGFSVSLCVIEIDNFKKVEELQENNAGELLLYKFVASTKKLIRDEIDFIFRIEKNRFAFLMTDCKEKNAHIVCKRINESFKILTEVSSLIYSIVEIKTESHRSLECYLKFVNNNLNTVKTNC